MLSKQEFGYWKQEAITKAVFTWAKEKQRFIEEDMLSRSVILKEGGQLKLCELAGMRDILDQLINLSIEDLNNDEES
jgi:hypothetical protein